MKRFLTLEKAEKEVALLNEYISLVNNYKVHDVNHWIIKNYALTNSIAGVIKKSLKDNTLETYNTIITREMVLEVLRAKPHDDLHKVVSNGYFKKIKKNKSTSSI